MQVKLGNKVQAIAGPMMGAAGVVTELDKKKGTAMVTMHGVVNGNVVDGAYPFDVADLEVLPNV